MVRILKYASFKGIRFEVEQHEDTFKRNIIKHPIALETEALYEDNGVEDEGFTIEGFLSGSDATYTVDLLRKKLKDGKTGRLIHPYYGMKNVLCKGYSVRESFRETGKVRLKFSFIEIKENKSDEDKDWIDKISEKYNATQEWISENITGYFTDALELARMPSYVVASAIQTVSNINSFIHSANGVGIIASEIGTIGDSVSDLESEIKRMLESTETLGKSIVAGIRNFPRLETAFNMYDRIERPSLVDSDLPGRSVSQTEAKNQRAFSDLIAFSAVVRVFDSIEREPGKNYEDIRIRSSGVCEELVQDPSSDKLFVATYQLKAMLENTSKRKKVSVELPQPSLVLAFDHYQDLSAEEFILGANEIVNPLVVSGDIYVD